MHLSNVVIAVFIYLPLSILNGLLVFLKDSTDATVVGISLEGCFKNLSNYASRLHLSDKNGPRHCFDECKNSEYIGLQENDCICNAKMGAYATERDCNFDCPGEKNTSCGSANTIYVYFKAQTNISVYGESGFIYLHVHRPVNDVQYRYEIIGTNDIREEHSYVCYDEPRKCFFHALGEKLTWRDAKAKCLDSNQGLAPYQISINETICIPKLPNGYYWIAMSWFKPVSTTTISSTSGISTMQTTTTMRRTSIVTIETSTPKTEIKSETVAVYIAPSVQPSPSDNTSNLSAVFVIIPIVVIATIMGVVYKKKKMRVKPCENRLVNDELQFVADGQLRDENGVDANFQKSEYGVRPGPSNGEDEDGIKNECQVEESGRHTERKARREERRKKRDEKKRRKEKKQKEKMKLGLINDVSEEGTRPKRDIATASGVRVNVEVSDIFYIPPGEHTDIRKVSGKFDIPPGEHREDSGKFDIPPGQHNDISKHNRKERKKKRKTTKRSDGFETNYLNLEQSVTAP